MVETPKPVIEIEEVVTPKEPVVEENDFAEVNQRAKEMEIKLPRPKEEKPKRMSREEVEALRQQSLNKLKGKTSEDTERHSVITNEEDKEFDTSMINISKIVGFENELDEQFEIIEQLNDKNTRKEGE